VGKGPAALRLQLRLRQAVHGGVKGAFVPHPPSVLLFSMCGSPRLTLATVVWREESSAPWVTRACVRQ
jgi:hypothetical protein